jgi:transposase
MTECNLKVIISQYGLGKCKAKRRRISTNEREAIIRDYENDQDFINTANIMGIKAATARSIVREFIKTGKRESLSFRGPRNVKVNSEMRLLIVEMQDANPLITLKEINHRLQEQLPGKPKICDQSVANVLEGELFSTKQVYLSPIPRKSPRVLELRKEYAIWFSQMQQNHISELVF